MQNWIEAPSFLNSGDMVFTSNREHSQLSSHVWSVEGLSIPGSHPSSFKENSDWVTRQLKKALDLKGRDTVEV
jgi:hypothetical protein